MDRIVAAGALTVSLISGIITALYIFTKLYLES